MPRLPKYVSGTTVYHVGGVLATVTVPTTGWTGSAAPYTISLTATGLTQGEAIFPRVECPENATQAQTALADFANLYKFQVTADNTLKIWAFAIPTAALTVQIW